MFLFSVRLSFWGVGVKNCWSVEEKTIYCTCIITPVFRESFCQDCIFAFLLIKVLPTVYHIALNKKMPYSVPLTKNFLLVVSNLLKSCSSAVWVSYTQDIVLIAPSPFISQLSSLSSFTVTYQSTENFRILVSWSTVLFAKFPLQEKICKKKYPTMVYYCMAHGALRQIEPSSLFE